MKVGIYKITNLINNRHYIGQSIDIEERWKEHRQNAYNKSKDSYEYPLYRAIRKYGLENFNFSIIEECRRDELNEKEIYYIEYYNSYYEGYNQTLGGHHSSPVKLPDNLLQQLIKDLQQGIPFKILQEKYNVNKFTLSRINNGHSWYQDDLSYPLFQYNTDKNKETVVNNCKICGQPISASATLCVECYHQQSRKVIRPSRNDLLKMVATSSFTAVAKLYNVTDNAIKKWCINYGLPSKKQEIINLYNEENNIVPTVSKKRVVRAVGQYNLDNQLIAIYANASEAGRQIGHSSSHITEACNKENGKAYGFIWRYID